MANFCPIVWPDNKLKFHDVSVWNFTGPTGHLHHDRRYPHTSIPVFTTMNNKLRTGYEYFTRDLNVALLHVWWIRIDVQRFTFELITNALSVAAALLINIHRTKNNRATLEYFVQYFIHIGVRSSDASHTFVLFKQCTLLNKNVVIYSRWVMT